MRSLIYLWNVFSFKKKAYSIFEKQDINNNQKN